MNSHINKTGGYMRRTRISAGPMVLAIMGMLAALSATGTAAGAQTDAFRPGGPDEAAAEFYSREFNVDLAEAAERLEGQDKLGRDVERISRLFRDRLAGHGIEHSSVEMTGWIVLKGREPVQRSERAALRQAERLGITVEFGAEFTHEELLAGARSIVELENRDVLLGEGLSGVDVDIRLNTLVIEYDEESGDSDAELSRFEQPTREVDNTLQMVLGEIPFRIETSADIADSATVRAGDAISTCTAGFGVVKNGTRGFLTAGHCRPNQNVNGVSAIHQEEDWGRFADLQWHSLPSGSSVRDDYRGGTFPNGTPYYRDVSAVESLGQMFGDYVCHWGRNSGYSCGTVTSTSYAPTYPNACNGSSCASVFVKVEGRWLEACGGDSGGPVFSGSRAYGIQKGANYSASCAPRSSGKWMIFTSLTTAEARLGVTILK